MVSGVDVFTHLVGQPDAAATLRAAASGTGMTHAWLFTGPAGSGRSVAARSFAAALQCVNSPKGCANCSGCHTVQTRTHPDVRFVVPEGLSIPVAQMRELVMRAATAPTNGRWQ